MLPRMWNQPPCMNMELSNELALPSPVIWHTQPSPLKGIWVPAGAVLRRSPGIRPYRQMLWARGSLAPKPCTTAHTTAFMPIST